MNSVVTRKNKCLVNVSSLLILATAPASTARSMAVLALPGRLDDKLETSVAGVVVDGYEGHGATALDAAGPDPAAHDHALAGEGVRGGQDRADGRAGRGHRRLQVVGGREIGRRCCHRGGRHV